MHSVLISDAHSTNTVQAALEWLEQHQDKSLEEIKESTEEPPALQPGEEARSLVCNDCGKKFRSQGQAEFHASKSGHVDFAESTEEIAPLTEEEKKQKLEDLRQRLAEKRATQSVQDKDDKKRNEVTSLSYSWYRLKGALTNNSLKSVGNPKEKHQRKPRCQRRP